MSFNISILILYMIRRMSDIPYSRIHVIYVLRLCAVGFGLHNIRDIFFRQWPLGVFNIFVACHSFKMMVYYTAILLH